MVLEGLWLPQITNNHSGSDWAAIHQPLGLAIINFGSLHTNIKDWDTQSLPEGKLICTAVGFATDKNLTSRNCSEMEAPSCFSVCNSWVFKLNSASYPRRLQKSPTLSKSLGPGPKQKWAQLYLVGTAQPPTPVLTPQHLEPVWTKQVLPLILEMLPLQLVEPPQNCAHVISKYIFFIIILLLYWLYLFNFRCKKP